MSSMAWLSRRTAHGSPLRTGGAAQWSGTSRAANREPGFNAVTHVDDVQAVAFLAGDRMLVSADGRGNLRLSDATTGNRLATLNGHAAKIWGISVSPDGMTLATASSDGDRQALGCPPTRALARDPGRERRRTDRLHAGRADAGRCRRRRRKDVRARRGDQGHAVDAELE